MADEGNGKTRKITIKYIQATDYKIIAANGAYGGVTPKGDIMMNLFVEHATVPESVTHDVVEGKLGPQVATDKGGSMFTRDLQIGVVMSADQAEQIAVWLHGKAEEVKKLKKEGSDG